MAFTLSEEIPHITNNIDQIRDEAYAHLRDTNPDRMFYTMKYLLNEAGYEEISKGYLGNRIRKFVGAEEGKKLNRNTAAITLAALYLTNYQKFNAVCEAAERSASKSGVKLSRSNVWARLIDGSLERVNRLVPARLLGAVVSALLREPNGTTNGLVMIRRLDETSSDVVLPKTPLTGEETSQWLDNTKGQLIWGYLTNYQKFNAVCEAAERSASKSGVKLSRSNVWARLIDGSLERVNRLVPARLLGAVVSALLREPNGTTNGLVMIRRLDETSSDVVLPKTPLTGEETSQWLV